MIIDLSKIEKPLVLYHADCITHDGWMAALLAKLRWPDAELIPVQYDDLEKIDHRAAGDGTVRWTVACFSKDRREDSVNRGNPVEHQIAGRDILVVDFSFPRESLLRMKEAARSLLVLDHHKTAGDNLAGLDFCVFDMERSGAGLALDYFWPGSRERTKEIEAGTYKPRVHIFDNHEMERSWKDGGLKGVAPTWLTHLALLIEDYDLWRFSNPNTRAVGIFLETIPKTTEAWAALPSIHEMAECGRALQSYRAGLVESIARNAYAVEISEPVSGTRGKILVVNTPLFKNEVADLLLRRDPEILAMCKKPEEILEAPGPLRAALSWYRHEDGFIICSLRSHPYGMDCSAYAKQRGGGGHERSAGYRITLDRVAGHYYDPSVQDIVFQAVRESL